MHLPPGHTACFQEDTAGTAGKFTRSRRLIPVNGLPAERANGKGSIGGCERAAARSAGENHLSVKVQQRRTPSNARSGSCIESCIEGAFAEHEYHRQSRAICKCDVAIISRAKGGNRHNIKLDQFSPRPLAGRSRCQATGCI